MIHIRDLSFRFQGGESYALRDIDLDIPLNKQIIITGVPDITAQRNDHVFPIISNHSLTSFDYGTFLPIYISTENDSSATQLF